MNSTDIIKKAKQRFRELERKEYEWKSFYNGFLEGCFYAIPQVKKLYKHDVVQQREQLIAFHDFCVRTVDLTNHKETTEERVERFLKSN